MPGLLDLTRAPQPPLQNDAFTVVHQKVELDVQFQERRITGRTELLVYPGSPHLKHIKLNFRQGEVDRVFFSYHTPTRPLGGLKLKAAIFEYSNSYDALHVYGVQNHHRLANKVDRLTTEPLPSDLDIYVPKGIRIESLDPGAPEAQAPILPTITTTEGEDTAPDTAPSARISEPSVAQYTPLTVHVEFHIDNVRDGLHFVGTSEEDDRYPHAYTRPEIGAGTASTLFPCIDNLQSRCTWDIGVRCPRTLRDLFKPSSFTTSNTAHGVLGITQPTRPTTAKSYLSADDEALEISVACSGDMTDEIVDPRDATRKTTYFACSSPLAPEQLGFAIGPFEHVDLSEFRESDEDALLGQKAIPLHAFCLPGRADEVRSTCLPVAKAIDWFSLTYGSYPFTSWKACFVDDLVPDSWSAGSMSIFSTRLLIPEEIVDNLIPTTRTVTMALASQWSGVNIIPREPTDTWATVGIASYMTDMFMKTLCGNNEYRFRMKDSSDQICELDHDRPSMHKTGALLRLEHSQMEFIALKAPVVLFILERRLTKASGKATLSRIIHRLFLSAQIGDLPNGALTTAQFQKTCEKLGHTKLDAFFAQWIYGSGCPRFQVSQRFNKKKLVVEMIIRQTQSEPGPPRDLERDSFLRDVREDLRSVYADPLQHVFTGSMTIRIHEADGTPYEHIVEIKEAVTKVEIPYNTKYKRLKRSKRQKERAAVGTTADPNVDVQDDVLIYCLGDVLQSEEEVAAWRLEDWSKEDEERMGQESYEWIRMDSDFEWISRITLGMPGYMFLSQLQQDRDVVAQYESVQYLVAQRENALVSTILLRTLMDKRYFYRIRTTAAAGLTKHAKPSVNWVGQHHLEKAFSELFCLPNSPMTRSNDFNDRASYMVQLAIPRALSQIRDASGKAPSSVINFLHDKLHFNDNSNNSFSDNFYVATLVKGMSTALLARLGSETETIGSAADSDAAASERQLDQECIAEIDRCRRMDEWKPSYQNVLSRTALDCQLELMKAGIMDVDYLHFIQFTRPGTSELLRETAFETLVDLGVFGSRELLEWYILNMTSDNSPRIRSTLHRLFGRALADVAFGTHKAPERDQQNEGLLVEADQDASAEARQAAFARRQTIEGALKGLKDELVENQTLREALNTGMNSAKLSPTELEYLLDWCRVLYDTVQDEMLIKLQLPFYWKVERLGNGQLRFFETDKVRTKPQKSYVPPPRNAASQAAVESGIGPTGPFKIKLPIDPNELNMQSTAAKIKTQSEQKEKLKLNLAPPKEKLKLVMPTPANQPKKLTMPKPIRRPSETHDATVDLKPIPALVPPPRQSDVKESKDLKRKRQEDDHGPPPVKRPSLIVKLKTTKFPPFQRPSSTPQSPAPRPVPKLVLNRPTPKPSPTPSAPLSTTLKPTPKLVLNRPGPKPTTNGISEGSSAPPIKKPLRIVFKNTRINPPTP